MTLPEKFATWKGIPREEIDWNPTIDAQECVGCGMCVTSCGRDVFDYDAEESRAIVARPLQCMVGCLSCDTWCIHGAISFPDQRSIRRLIRERGVLQQARRELEEQLSS